MKKIKSLLALLLLGGMVLSGCGDKDKRGNPSDSGTPSTPSGTDDSSGGTPQGNDQGGGGGGSQGGGDQHGGGGEGGEVPTDSQFVNKKFVFDSLSCPQDQSLEATLTANYQGAYAALFSNGKFQLVSVVNTYTMALLGDFTVAQDDSYARLDVRKEYDGETQGYEYLESGTFVTNLRYNEGLQKYVLPMRNSNGMGGTINFDVYLTLSNELPQAADLPDDPNGEEFDPAYQVRKDVWDRLIVERGLLHASTSNYKVTSGTTIFEVDDGEKYYEHYTDGTPNSGLFWQRTSIENGTYYYTHTIISNGAVYSTSSPDYGIDFFDSSVGLAPIPFNWMQYDSVGHYYYRSSYTYQNSFYNSVTVNNYRVYFSANYKLSKITYEDNAHQAFEFIFSNHGQIDLNLDDLTNGGGGGGNVNTLDDYNTAIANTQYVFNRLSGSNWGEMATSAGQVYANGTLSLFSNGNVEINTAKTFGEHGEILDTPMTQYGTYALTGITTDENLKEYGAGNSTFNAHLMNGVYTVVSAGYEMNYSMRVYLQDNEIRLMLGSGQYMYFAKTNVTPTPTAHPNPAFVPCLHYSAGLSWEDESMPASGPYLAKLEHFYLFEDDEFVIHLTEDTWLYFEDYQGTPDLAGGMITQGAGTGSEHNFHVGEDGYYDIRVDSNQHVIIEHETSGGGGGDPQSAVWPSDWVDALYAAWGINDDIIPECGTTGVTSFMTSPETPTNGDTYGIIAAIGGESLYDSYVAALGVAGYGPNVFGYYVSANKELMILPQVNAGALSIMIFPYDSSLEINDASLLYYDGYNTQNIALEYDSVKDEYFIKDVFLYEEFEFFLYIPGEGSYYFDDFVVRTPDTSKGNISEGSEFVTGNYGLYVEADGSYDIYLNSSREIDVVYDIIPLLQYGSDLEGWLTEPFEKANGQLELHDFYLEAGTEVVIHLNEEGEYGTWLHYDNFVETEFSAGKIGGTGASNLTILVSGSYTFYVTGGSIYIVYEGE